MLLLSKHVVACGISAPGLKHELGHECSITYFQEYEAQTVRKA
jgi:hypothetical protein